MADFPKEIPSKGLDATADSFRTEFQEGPRSLAAVSDAARTREVTPEIAATINACDANELLKYIQGPFADKLAALPPDLRAQVLSHPDFSDPDRGFAAQLTAGLLQNSPDFCGDTPPNKIWV